MLPNDNARNWERLCEWMEPKPALSPTDYRPWRDRSEGGWRVADGYDSQAARWVPCAQTRDACSLAEDEIDRRGRSDAYDAQLSEITINNPGTYAHVLIRLTPAQRCAAMLAAVEASAKV